MPSLSAHQSSTTTKLLVIGDSGAGKTGALASLASAGYNLRIIDADNGLDVLANTLRSTAYKYDPGSLSRVEFETITDTYRSRAGKLVPTRATAWPRLVELLSGWKTQTAEFGPVSSWTPRDVLVLDSLTFICSAAMRYILMLNSRLDQQPHQADWFAAQGLVEGLLDTLKDSAVGCNIVVNCHLVYLGEENGPQTAYPASLGKALSPKIGRYFNNSVRLKTKGTGTGQRRVLITTSDHQLELKNTNPAVVKAEYPIETGLADFFSAIRGPLAPLAS